MADSGVREIQLTGKQLVFLFMASVVLIVSVFLLGVSVGRGVRGTQVMAEAAAPQATTTEPPAPLPASTPGASDATTYHTALPAGGAQATPPASNPVPPASLAPPPKTSPAPPPASTPPATPPPAATNAKSDAAKPEPPSSSAAKTATSAKPAPSGIWFVQIETLRSKDSADSLAARLKAKGYAVSIVDSQKPFYKVRVGPYQERSDAEAAAQKVKKDGFSTSPFVTR